MEGEDPKNITKSRGGSGKFYCDTTIPPPPAIVAFGLEPPRTTLTESGAATAN